MVITDKQIVETLKQQPEAGFRQLMARYREPVYWHIRRLVVRHDDAQDVAQETFVRVFRSLHQYRADCSLRSWIYIPDSYKRGLAVHLQTAPRGGVDGKRSRQCGTNDSRQLC